MPGYLLPQEFAYSFESFGFTKHLISWVLVSTPNCQLLVTVTGVFFPHFLFLSFNCAIMSNSFCIWNHMGGQLEEDIQKGIENPNKWMKKELCICSLLPNPPSPQPPSNPPIFLQCSPCLLSQMINFVWFSALSPYCKHVKICSPLHFLLREHP